MHVLGIQLDSVWENKAANHAKVRHLLLEAQPVPDSLVVLPEMFATGFSLDVERIAEDSDGPTHQWLAATAREYNVYLIGGVVTLGPTGKGRNEAVGFDPSGREIVRYTKMHPFTYAGESEHFSAGETPVTFLGGAFTIAPFVCYDLRFPEVFRMAVKRGANAFVIIANWPTSRQQHWITLLQARAVENQAYVIGVNRVGRDPNLMYGGRSLIVDPRGDVLADGSDRECVVRATLDFELLRAYRSEFPFLADARH